MTKQEFKTKLGIIQNVIDNVNKSLNTTDISPEVLSAYLLTEVNIDINNHKILKIFNHEK